VLCVKAICNIPHGALLMIEARAYHMWWSVTSHTFFSKTVAYLGFISLGILENVHYSYIKIYKAAALLKYSQYTACMYMYVHTHTYMYTSPLPIKFCHKGFLQCHHPDISLGCGKLYVQTATLIFWKCFLFWSRLIFRCHKSWMSDSTTLYFFCRVGPKKERN
jgi:hypothetical protein